MGVESRELPLPLPDPPEDDLMYKDTTSKGTLHIKARDIHPSNSIHIHHLPYTPHHSSLPLFPSL